MSTTSSEIMAYRFEKKLRAQNIESTISVQKHGREANVQPFDTSACVRVHVRM